MGEQDGFVETGSVRIIYSKRTIDIGPGNLGADGHGITVGTPPRGGADIEARVDINVIAHSKGVDGNGIFQGTEHEFNGVRGFIGYRAHINILANAVFTYMLYGNSAQNVYIFVWVYAYNVHGLG